MKGDLTKNFDSRIDFKLYKKDFPNRIRFYLLLKDLAYLHARRLQAIRDQFNVPITVTSFYRSPYKNSETRYAQTGSLHTRGLAVDITVSEKNRHLLLHMFLFMRDNFDYGELFLYELPDGTLNSIHFSLQALNNNKETLRYIKEKDGTLTKKGD